MDLDNSIEKTLTQIQNVMSANSIVGTPINAGDKVIIPISKTALGFGVGVGNNDGKSTTALGGAGGGGSIDPVAFIVVYANVPGPEGVEVLPVDNIATPIEDLLTSVGKIAFDFLGGTNAQQDVEQEPSGNIDKIKTKIKINNEKE